MTNVQQLRPLSEQSPEEVRRVIRTGQHTTETAGLAMGYIQGNLVVLPEKYALDFATFCQRNPKPCPLIAVSEKGDPSLPTLARDLDLRSDLPKYRVFRDGEFVAAVTDISDLWRDDFVAFVLGCSFSFEEALVEEGLELRHLTEGKCVPAYNTTIPCAKSGPFEGGMVVSMRPFSPGEAIRAIEVTSRFPLTHGAPVHLGDPTEIGIVDLDRPDYGDAVTVRPGEVPLYWACGITPQVVVTNAKPEICITHYPGHMVITDLPSKGSAQVLPKLAS
jgi:uncharacterized protein YcsI (UPF0317 family)